MLERFNVFKRLDARARVVVLFGGMVAVVVLIYLATRLLSGPDTTTGPSKVANAPSGLQNVPGSTTNPEYAKAMQQYNTQMAQQAVISGGSAIPSQVNLGMAQGTGNCIVCSDQNTNVANSLNDWKAKGQISPDVADDLQALADKNVSVEDYAAELARLVKEGKLTPEQARQLLEEYKKQHANKLLNESGQFMDQMIKSGQLPLDVATMLLDAQKRKMTPAEYAAMLQELVREGKISPALAQQLLAQYTQQHAREIINRSVASIHALARNSQITPEIENALVDLENRMVPVELYSATLQSYISGGKIIPAVASRILDEYKSQKNEIGPSGSINQMLQQAESAAYAELDNLQSTGKITPDVAAQLKGMIQQNVSMDDFRAVITQLVKQGKMTPDIAKLKLADYTNVKNLREMAAKLSALQGNNASPEDYANALKEAVQSGALTPAQAEQLMQEYLAATQRAAPTTPINTTAAGEQLARLQQLAQQGSNTVAPPATAAEFEAAQNAAYAQLSTEKQQRVDAIAQLMSGQAAQLINAWQPPKMQEFKGSEEPKTKEAIAQAAAAAAQAAAGGTGLAGGPSGPPLIKAGTVLFAVLDTAANSDYPDSPVMATIVEGKYKGAKLLGKLTTAKNVAGQLDRISLTFTMMNMEDWIKSRSINAFAIDPDTARTVMASSVNYHYMKRFGAIFATSFLQGYASAITNAGTSTTGIFGTSTTHPDLSPSQKFMTALGQVGTTLGNTTQNWINIPPTVKVDSGVSLGILFMQDVT